MSEKTFTFTFASVQCERTFSYSVSQIVFYHKQSLLLLNLATAAKSHSLSLTYNKSVPSLSYKITEIFMADWVTENYRHPSNSQQYSWRDFINTRISVNFCLCKQYSGHVILTNLRKTIKFGLKFVIGIYEIFLFLVFSSVQNSMTLTRLVRIACSSCGFYNRKLPCVLLEVCEYQEHPQINSLYLQLTPWIVQSKLSFCCDIFIFFLTGSYPLLWLLYQICKHHSEPITILQLDSNGLRKVKTKYYFYSICEAWSDILSEHTE